MASGAMAQEIGATFSKFDDNWLTVLRNGMTEYAGTIDGLSYQQEDASDDLAKQIDQVNEASLAEMREEPLQGSWGGGDPTGIYLAAALSGVVAKPPSRRFIAKSLTSTSTRPVVSVIVTSNRANPSPSFPSAI